MEKERVHIKKVLNQELHEAEGFEWWPFRVGNYNALANSAVQLKYHSDAMAAVVLTNPYFFERAFKKRLISNRKCGENAVDFGKRFGCHPIRDFFLNKFDAIETRRRMGLALHAKYGGHFSFRGAIIFPNTYLPAHFKEPAPVMTLTKLEEIREALELINVHWRDNKYRDCGNPAVRYSDLQLQYFSVLPRYRWKLLAHWFD